MTITAISADGVGHEFPDGTDPDVIGHVMRQYATSKNSVIGDLKGGAHDLGTAVSQGLSSVGLPNAAKFVDNYTPDAPSGPTPSEQLSGALQHGEWSTVPGLVGHSLARGAVSALPVIGGAAVAGPIGAGVAGGALALGPTAYSRAANNGRTEPTTSDVLEAIPGAAAEGAGAALLGPASKAASPIVRAGVGVAKDALAGAGMDLAGQVGGSAGTDKGLSVNPYQTAGSGLTMGALGASRVAPGLAGDAAKAGVDRAMASTLEGPASTPDAQSVIRVGQLMDDVRQNQVNNTGKAQPDTVVANSVKADLHTKLLGQVRELRDVGIIDPSDAQDLRSLITNQALRNNNTISEGLPGVSSLYDRLADMDIPDETKRLLQDDIRDLNTVSSNSFINQTTGPAQQLGKALGKYGGAAYELTQGNVPGAVMAGVFGHGVGGKVGGALGSGIDRMLGTNTPPVVLQRINAAKALQRAGMDPKAVSPTGDYPSLRPTTDEVGNPISPIPVNTPIPANGPARSPLPSTLRVDTPETVRQAVAQDNQPQPAAPLSAPATGAPMDMPAGHPTSPLWERFAANGNPALTRAQVREAASKVYTPDQMAVLDAHRGGYDPKAIQPIQAQLASMNPQGLGATASSGSNTAGVNHNGDPIRNPIAYGVQARANQARMLQLSSAMRATGDIETANAIDKLAGINLLKDKQEFVSKLDPNIQAKIPQWVLEFGGK